jgi:hypothetical protein
VVSDSSCSGEGVGERGGAGVAQTATGGGADKVWLFFFVCDQVRI